MTKDGNLLPNEKLILAKLLIQTKTWFHNPHATIEETIELINQIENFSQQIEESYILSFTEMFSTKVAI